MNPLFLSLLAVVLLSTGCQKPAEVDIRDQYVGSYRMQYDETLRNVTTGQSYDRKSSGTLNVSKGGSVQQLTMTDPRSFNVDLSSERFTVLSHVSQETVNGNSYAFNVSGFGNFTSNGISLGRVSTATISGQRFQLTTTGTGTK